MNIHMNVDAQAFADRITKIIDDTLLANANQITTGGCPDFETYRFLVGMNQGLLTLRDRIKAELTRIKKEQFSNE